MYREIILQIPPTPSPPEALSRESTSLGANDDLTAMLDNLTRQYPDVPREQLRQLFAEVSEEYRSEHQLRDKELALLAKFQ